MSRLIDDLLIDFGPEFPRVLQLSDAAHREEDWLIKDAFPVLLHVFTVRILDRFTDLDAVLLLRVKLLLSCKRGIEVG